ncbi:response regulator transcription factor [Nocardioides sp. zg-DK7169]|uniref:response regulator transcription factor n=1 Tax=Nocardioides sp. zg-DK7169 TaxID=2736600 RepID=UPI001555B568|nr:response regulator transcription factor [Nocardioides sp. zg-DK7169]NPC95708.1 response regulator transcription factor [Nocardioides sp. zg-DK7169]
MTGGDADWTAVIIEDDPDVRDLIDIVLTQSGFRTIVAEDGPDGVEAVRRHNPLLTTLDVNMPGMDGFAVAKRLREFSSTYLIMITALADEIDVVQGFEAGADDYLVKPFRPRELRARADSMLRRPRTRQEVPAAWARSEPPVAPKPVEKLSWAARAARDLGQGSPLSPLGAGEPTPPAAAPVAPAAVVAPPAPVAPAPPVAAPVVPPAAPVAPPAPVAPVVPPAPVAAQSPVAQSPVVQSPVAPAAVASDGWLRFSDLALNPETGVLTLKGGVVDVTRTELDLLVSLIGTGRRVRSKADLVLTMRGEQYVTSYFVNEADKRAVETHIASLRRKLGDDGATARYIETVRGVGYRMAEPV